MPFPKVITKINKRVLNPVLIKLAGRGRFARLTHVGRRSGRVFQTPLLAFRQPESVVVALTYGPDVDWLRNLTAAGRGRLVLGTEELVLGPPSPLPTDEGRRAMPLLQRTLVPLIGVRDFVAMPVMSTRPA